MFARDAKFDDWATLVQTVRANDFRGRRVRLSGYLRSENVLGGAALWMRVDGLRGTLGFNGMEHRWFAGPPTGSARRVPGARTRGRCRCLRCHPSMAR